MQLRLWLGVLVVVALAHTAQLCCASSDTPILQLCTNTAQHLSFNRHSGEGSGLITPAGTAGGCDELAMAAASAAAMAADFATTATIAIPAPLAIYKLSYEVETRDLLPLPPAPHCTQLSPLMSQGPHLGNVDCATPYLTGGAYVSYEDAQGLPTGWFPAFGELAPPTSAGFRSQQLVFTPPTTAVRMTLHLAFAAHAYLAPRMTNGRATGRAVFRNITLALTAARSSVQPPPLRLIESGPASTNISTALGIVARCLHNSQLSGNFTVGADYVISGNISPDLAFGLFGVRHFNAPAYMDVYAQQWQANGAIIMPSGQMGYFQRVMAQTLWPLGMDALFSFSGNTSALAAQLPIADRSMAYLHTLAQQYNDILPCFPKALMDQYPPGVDWVDWQESRGYGATMNFQTWYVYCLRRLAALHREFAGSFGNATRATEYAQRADDVAAAVRSRLWRGDHFATNARFDPQCAAPTVLDDDVWVDDQLWAVVLGVADDSQTQAILAWLAARPDFEAAPTRWSNKTAANARYRETWYGRLGAGDVLMRYRHQQPQLGYQLLQRIASLFAAYNNIYESYTMEGQIGGDKGSDYLEHAGGFVWSLLAGPFGLDTDSDGQAAATLAPQFPADWQTAQASFTLRGVNVTAAYADGRLAVSASGGRPGASTVLRVVFAGKTSLVPLHAN